MKYLKKFESLFNQRMGDKLWVEFDSTHEPFETSTGHIAGSWQFNSMKDFRNYHKRITPTQAQIDSVIELLKSSIEGINNVKYYSKWRQIYCNMWDDEKQYTYAENEKLNKIKIIIDFYDEDWYFVALCDENTRWGETETHFACDDFDGLKQWLSDHKTIIENKK